MRSLLLILATIFCINAVLAESADSPIRPSKELVATAKANTKEITEAELASITEREIVLIDVREPYEWDKGYIPGAVNIPRGQLEFKILDHPALAKIAQADPASLPDTEIVLYCRSGNRSALAAQSLQSMGFENVYSLQGGFKAWSNAERPVEKQ